MGFFWLVLRNLDFLILGEKERGDSIFSYRSYFFKVCLEIVIELLYIRIIKFELGFFGLGF